MMRTSATLLSKLFDPLAKRSRRNEQTLVDEPRRARRLMLRDLALFVIVIAATWIDDTATGWLDLVALLIVGVYVGWGAFQTTRKMLAYRSGWLDGRAALIHSLAEARRRGLDGETWVELELARDISVMGIELRSPPPPPPPDGSHDDI